MVSIDCNAAAVCLPRGDGARHNASCCRKMNTRAICTNNQKEWNFVLHRYEPVTKKYTPFDACAPPDSHTSSGRRSSPAGASSPARRGRRRSRGVAPSPSPAAPSAAPSAGPRGPQQARGLLRAWGLGASLFLYGAVEGAMQRREEYALHRKICTTTCAKFANHVLKVCPLYIPPLPNAASWTEFQQNHKTQQSNTRTLFGKLEGGRILIFPHWSRPPKNLGRFLSGALSLRG